MKIAFLRTIALLVFIAGAAIGASAPAQRTITLKPADGAGAVVAITVDAGRTTITAGSTRLNGETKDGQKRRYVNQDGAVIAEVRLGETDGFKVRTPAGKLLWKVKVTEAKTKISDNEENKDAYELSTKGNTVRVTRDERLIGALDLAPAANGGRTTTAVRDANGKVLFTVDPAVRSVAAGVALLEPIPADYRRIIIVELFARAK